MIRAMQTIILAALVQIPMPGHALLFMQGCMYFAQMDLFDGAELYAQIFTFKETLPLNKNFESFGLMDKNLIMNSGSFFIFFSGFVVINTLLFFLNWLATVCARFQPCRKLGMKVYSKSHI